MDAEQYEDTIWDVEKVVGKRYDSEGRPFYLIKWKSYNGEPTWEPKENCNCSDLIEQYETIIRTRENDASRDDPPPVPSNVSAMSQSHTRRSSRGSARVSSEIVHNNTVGDK